MAIAATQFNIFGSVTQKDISVGYISSTRGYVPSISLCEANDYEKENPNTAFILRNRDKVSYIGIDQVNSLVPDDLLPTDPVNGCSAIDLEHKCDPTPEVSFYGGGGVGAFANPVIGTDGGLLTLDITNPGFGYQYPPKVEVKDECGIAKGAVVRVQVSDGDNCVETLKYYKDEMDEDGPEICDDVSIPYGRVWGVDGQDTGEWDPTKYTRYAEDPLMDEIDKYLESLKNLKNPWWTTRQDLNQQHITSSKDGKVTTVGYAVSVTDWSDFLNLYGISPVEPSDEPGTAHGGETFDFKWDIDFPWGGEYIFRGLYSGAVGFGDLYIDEQKVATLSNKDGLTDPIKYEVGIATTKSVSFKLHNAVNTKKAPIQPKKEPIVRVAGGKFIKEGKNYFYKVSGNDLVDIDFDFFWDKSIDGKEKPAPTIPERVQAKFQVYTSGGGDGLKFRFTAADGSHSFEINSDNYVHDDPAKDLFVNVKPNIDYNIVSSRRSGTTEQGCLKESRFGRRGKEQDEGTSRCIFCDKVGSRDDDDDLQVRTTDASGLFTAGAAISSGSSKHDSFAITYRYGGVAPVDNTPKERPAITKLTIQTEKDPLVFEIPKTDSQSGNTSGGQKAWVPVKSWPYVYPSDNEVLTDQWHIGEWQINITTPGNYILEARADDRCKASWDGNELFRSTKKRSIRINDVKAGTHKLSMGVWNKSKYGSTWDRNPGALRWFLKDPSGTVVANSRDPFNDTKPANNLGKGGKDWQQKGTISKKGNFKNGRKYRVTFDRLPYTKDPEIGDTGDVTVQPETNDQKIDFFDKGHRKGNTLQIITPKNVIFAARNAYQLSKADSRVVYPEGIVPTQQSIFNTLQYIDKSNRRLWKTKNASGLLGKFGVAPFDTNLSLPNMPYGGNHEIIWSNITFPVTTNYDIEVHVDDEVRIQIGDQVDFTKLGFSKRGDPRTHTGQTTHTFYIKAGTYAIKTTLYQWNGETDSTGGAGGSDRTGKQLYKVLRYGGDFSGDIIDIKTDWRFRGNTTASTLRYNADGSIRMAQMRDGSYMVMGRTKYGRLQKYKLQKLPNSSSTPSSSDGGVGKWATTNPMGVAIDIKTKVAYKTVPDPKSWNEKPMGVALTIKAPTPPPPAPVLPPELEEGECPQSPIWHTRMKPEGAPWYPVKFGYWHKWTNKYAISPIPPLNSPGTDGTGNSEGWEQSWIINAPYEGDYTFKGTVDNFGQIFVNGNLVAERNDDPNIAFRDEEYKRSSLDVVVKPQNREEPWPTENKFYMPEGENIITAKIQNFKNYETRKKYFTEKIFSTKDWQSAAPVKSNKNNKPEGIMFTKTGSKYYLTAYGNDIVDADLGYVWDALQGAGPPPPPAREQVTFRVYTSGGDNVGLNFKFTAADGSHSFTINADDFVDNGPAVDLNVNLKPNVTYNVMSSRNRGKIEQGLITPGSFGQRGVEQDTGTSTSIFTDKVGSSDDDNDLQVQCKSGIFTAGGSHDNGTSKHDSWYITYRLRPGGESSPNTIPPSVTKITVQTEKDPLVFEVPKSDALSPSTGGAQKAWVPVHSWPYVYPSDNDPLRDQWHTGEWTINITTPGNYTLEARADDRCKASWDGNQLFGTVKKRTVRIANVSAGIHKLSASVWNKGKYGSTWKSNPGALRWFLKDSNGTVVANSRDPFGGSNPADNTGKGGEQWKASGTIKKRGSWKAGKTYEITFKSSYGKRADGSIVLQKPTPIISESGWTTEEQTEIKPNPKMSFADPWDYLQAISVYQMSSAVAVEQLIIDNTRNGVTYKGPALYNFRHKSYGDWMNENGISPDYPKTGGGETINYVWSNVNFPVTGEYEFRFANDAHGSLYLDGQTVIDGDFDTIAGVSARDRANWDPGLTRKMEVTKGKHTIAIAPKGRLGRTDVNADGLFRKLSEDYYRGQQAWNNNPSGVAVGITRLVEDVPEPGTPEAAASRGKSWYQNPIGLCGIIIPPPCKQIKCGKGRLKDPIVDDPGSGFLPPPTQIVITDPPPAPELLDLTTYRVHLELTDVEIGDPGINYNPGDPTTGEPPDTPIVVDPPDSNISLGCSFTPHGGISDITILDPGDGVTSTVRIEIPSKTGVNFWGTPVLTLTRDPVDVPDPEKLVQVTDLVGLKQTGYIEGRAYYGSVYYKEGIPYAGITETAGKAIQVYTTLQESIDAQRTTPPSAIQRQGTDITSNDPRLNIPGTPDNLT